MEKGMSPSSPPPPDFSPEPAHGGPPPPPQLYTEAQPDIVHVSSLQFGSESQRLTCPHCHRNISTCWCCAACPYVADSWLVKKHYCPACKAYLGESVN